MRKKRKNSNSRNMEVGNATTATYLKNKNESTTAEVLSKTRCVFSGVSEKVVTLSCCTYRLRGFAILNGSSRVRIRIRSGVSYFGRRSHLHLWESFCWMLSPQMILSWAVFRPDGVLGGTLYSGIFASAIFSTRSQSEHFVSKYCLRYSFVGAETKTGEFVW